MLDAKANTICAPMHASIKIGYLCARYAVQLCLLCSFGKAETTNQPQRTTKATKFTIRMGLGHDEDSFLAVAKPAFLVPLRTERFMHNRVRPTAQVSANRIVSAPSMMQKMHAFALDVTSNTALRGRSAQAFGLHADNHTNQPG